LFYYLQNNLVSKRQETGIA